MELSKLDGEWSVTYYRPVTEHFVVVMCWLSEEQEVEEQAAEESVVAKTTKPLRPEPVEVTEDNLSKFKLTDIVLPLPGYDVRYPQNQVKSWYEEFLKKDGMENFNFKSKVR